MYHSDPLLRKTTEAKDASLVFLSVPLPPLRGTKGQGRKLAPGTGKDIITYSRAEPSGLHPCHRSRNSVVSKGKEHYQGKGGGWKHTVYRKNRGVWRSVLRGTKNI